MAGAAILAGTAEGVYEVAGGRARLLLQSNVVRELVRINGRVFAGTDSGLHRSDDDGETWEYGGLFDREVWQVRGAGGDTIYASTHPPLLYRRENGGPWRELRGLTRLPEASGWLLPGEEPTYARARALAIDAANPARLWVGVEVGGVARSIDRGKTWKVSYPGGNPDIHMMFAWPARPGTLFASTGYGRTHGAAPFEEGNAGVFRSDDYGGTWRYVWAGIEPRYTRPMCVDPRAPYPLTVGAAPSASARAWDAGGAQAMLFRSDDGGGSWRSLGDAEHSPSRANFHALAPDPETPGGVLAGTDTGEIWRVSPAAEWTRLAERLPYVLAILPP